MTTDDRLADLRVALTLIANECVPPTDQHTIARIQSLAHNALAAGVRVAPSPDALREAAQAVVDAWDEDAVPEEDGFDPMVNSIDALRAAIEEAAVRTPSAPHSAQESER